jgi:hypothetical protein
MSVFDLWLPILLTALATHVLCTLAWTALPHHKPEWKRLPIEDELMDLLVARGVAVSQYMFPHAGSGEEARSEAFQAKQARCRGMLVLWDSPLNMGAAIGKTLVFFFVAAFCVAYIASLGLHRGDDFRHVFQFATTAGLLAHCFAHFPHVFWFRRRIVLEVIDGVVYALATGLIFAACWPA